MRIIEVEGSSAAWLPCEAGVIHLFGDDDELLESSGLAAVAEAQHRGAITLWLSSIVHPAEWIRDLKGVRPDLGGIRVADYGALMGAFERVFEGAMEHRARVLVVWQNVAGPLDAERSAQWSARLHGVLPIVRRRLRASGSQLLLLNRAVRKPREVVCRPAFGAVIQRAARPLLTAYVVSGRNVDAYPDGEAERAALLESIKRGPRWLIALDAAEVKAGFDARAAAEAARTVVAGPPAQLKQTAMNGGQIGEEGAAGISLS
jgi:hypothetical protein